ncbi:MAG: cyclic nucleotide-binding domain-containing protein [Deltaproteobacteria bacterium]|nr:cyclic nucleotide-binding domain-containing protein [Deltaproteobacteria bacterium]
MNVEPVTFALLQSGLFARLSAEAFRDVVKGIALVELPAGAWLFREGDAADAAYVVVAGAVQVLARTDDEREIVIGRLGPGEHFGEQSLLGGADRTREAKRGASVRCVEATRLARIEPEVLHRLVSGDDALLARLDEVGRAQRDEKLARSTEVVRSLLEIASAEAREVTFREGDVLFREGDPPDAMFVVLAGRVAIYVEKERQPVRLTTVGPGMCIGERGVARGAPRAATAIADERVRALRVDMHQFASVADKSKELRDHLATLERVYALPRRGFVTEHAGRLEGEECVTQLYHLGSRRLVVSHLVGAPGLLLEATGVTASRTIRSHDGAVVVEVAEDGQIARLRADDRTEVAATLITLAMDAQPLSAAAEQALVAGASLGTPEEGTVCTCLRVPRESVRALARSGATLPVIQARLGCGTVCGSCVPAVIEMLGGSAFQPIVIDDVRDVARDVRAFRLAPRDPQVSLSPGRPGQHVVLRARIAGRPVDRPYTLTSPPSLGWEVTVRREDRGLFSRWLFENGARGTALEASAPRGDHVWEGGPDPVVCFVAGIGATPAICFARTVIDDGLPHRLVIDWSSRTDDDFPFFDEIERAARARANITLRRRVTTREPRITESDVEAWARRFPSARFFVCGPEGYDEAIGAWLSAAGVPRAQIRVERFVHSGAPIGATRVGTARPSDARSSRATTTTSRVRAIATRLGSWLRRTTSG